MTRDERRPGQDDRRARMDHDASAYAAEAAATDADAARLRLQLAQEMLRPSMMLRPALAIDGNKWCALYGTDLMNGVAGFGDSPDDAYRDFDTNWFRSLKERAQ